MPGFFATFLIWSILYALGGLALAGGAAGLRGGPPARARLGWGTLLGLGMCFFAFTGFLLSWAGLRNYLPVQFVVLLLLLGLRVASPDFRRSLLPAPDAGETGDEADRTGVDWPRLLTLLGLFYLAARWLEVCYLSAFWPLNQWDALAIWGLKAKVLFYQPLGEAGYFHDLSKSYSHLDYPLLLPLLQSQLYLLRGIADDALVTALYPLLYLALLAGFYEVCRALLGLRPALFFTVLLAAVEEISTMTPSGRADMPLGLFLLLCGGNLLLWQRTGSSARLYAGTALGCAALFTKNEGLPAFILALLVFAIAPVLLEREREVRRARAAALGRALLLAAVLAAPWLVFRLDLPKTHENYGGRLALSAVAAGLGRLPVIASRFAEQVASWRSWHVLWWLPVLAAALRPRAALSGQRLQVLGFLLCMLGVYTAVYAVTPWDVDLLLQVSLSRLLVHLAPLCLLFTVLVAEELLN